MAVFTLARLRPSIFSVHEILDTSAVPTWCWWPEGILDWSSVHCGSLKKLRYDSSKWMKHYQQVYNNGVDKLRLKNKANDSPKKLESKATQSQAFPHGSLHLGTTRGCCPHLRWVFPFQTTWSSKSLMSVSSGLSLSWLEVQSNWQLKLATQALTLSVDSCQPWYVCINASRCPRFILFIFFPSLRITMY